MNEIITKHTSLTPGTVVLLSGMIASNLSVPGLSDSVSKGGKQSLHQNLYETSANLPSHSHVKVTPQDFEKNIDCQFVETVSSFYEQLVKKQEPLGQEFEQVLLDNIWDLYEEG